MYKRIRNFMAVLCLPLLLSVSGIDAQTDTAPTPTPDGFSEGVSLAPEVVDYLLDKLDTMNARQATWVLVAGGLLALISAGGFVLLYNSVPARRIEILTSANRTVDAFDEKIDKRRQEATQTETIVDDIGWGVLGAGVDKLNTLLEELLNQRNAEKTELPENVG